MSQRAFGWMCVMISGLISACPLQAQQPAATASSSLPNAATLARLKKYEQFALTHEGDAQRGRQLFLDEKTSKCVTCHQVGGKGGDVGPDLSAIGGKFARPHLIESLLEPSRQIVEGFRSSTLLLDNGKILTGVIRKQTEGQLTIGDNQGQLTVVPIGEVEEQIENDLSIMPEGIADSFTQQQFTDVIAYLETLRPGGKPKHGSGITGPIKLPDGFDIQLVASGLTGCTAMETLSDGRVLICEQTGTLRIVKDNQLLAEPVLSLEVDDYWERGLIGVTVHPQFSKTPHLFVCYVAKDPYPHHRISRFTLRGDVVQPGSEQILLEGDDQTKLGGKVPAGHQGGALHFGVDGKLYIAIGEQTSKQPSQRLDSLLGKLLRINPDGTIPKDNPFYKTAKGKYRAIWALGLRNPFTFAIRETNGDMCINDIGQNLFEEVNLGVAGGNYGWPITEGPTDDARFVGPLFHYPNASACGADFAPTDLGWPSRFGGRYFFGEYILGWIKTMDVNHPNDIRTFVSGLRNPVDLRFAADGSLYVLVRNAWVRDEKFQPHTGSLLRIRYIGQQQVSAGDEHAAGQVRLTKTAIDRSAGDLPAYKIETPSATYFLEKSGAGLSSLIDRDGHDWLGFHPASGSGSAGEYRGFPNAVHQQAGSYFHPKNKATDPARTKIEYAGPQRVSIAAESGNGQWACRYDFLPTHCKFTMTRMPEGKKFWVLYEGTPGGQYDDADWWMTSASPQRRPMTENHEGDIPSPEWIAFGDHQLRRALLILHHRDDSHPDRFYQMNTEMTVFGFGRKGLSKFLDSVPQQFSIGLLESVEHQQLSEMAGRWQQDPSLSGQ